MCVCPFVWKGQSLSDRNNIIFILLLDSATVTLFLLFLFDNVLFHYFLPLWCDGWVIAATAVSYDLNSVKSYIFDPTCVCVYRVQRNPGKTEMYYNMILTRCKQSRNEIGDITITIVCSPSSALATVQRSLFCCIKLLPITLSTPHTSHDNSPIRTTLWLILIAYCWGMTFGKELHSLGIFLQTRGLHSTGYFMLSLSFVCSRAPYFFHPFSHFELMDVHYSMILIEGQTFIYNVFPHRVMIRDARNINKMIMEYTIQISANTQVLMLSVFFVHFVSIVNSRPCWSQNVVGTILELYDGLWQFQQHSKCTARIYN